MPGFNQEQIDARAQTGNLVAILVGDVPIGFGQTASPSIDFGAEGLYGIGSRNPQEIPQLKNSMQFTLDAFALTEAGIEALGYPSDILEVLSGNKLNISVVNADGSIDLTYVGCVCNTFTKSIPANQPVTEQMTFLAMDVIGPDGKSVLAGVNAYEIPGTAQSGGSGLGISVSGTL